MVRSKSKRVTDKGTNTRLEPKILKPDNLPLRFCHLISSRVKQMSECWADEDELDDNHTSGQRFCVVSALLLWLSHLLAHASVSPGTDDLRPMLARLEDPSEPLRMADGSIRPASACAAAGSINSADEIDALLRSFCSVFTSSVFFSLITTELEVWLLLMLLLLVCCCCLCSICCFFFIS